MNDDAFDVELQCPNCSVRCPQCRADATGDAGHDVTWTCDQRVITVAGAAGGVGTTTACIAVALYNANRGVRTLLASSDYSGLITALGSFPQARRLCEVTANLTVADIAEATLADVRDDYPIVVVDNGTDLTDADVWCIASDYRSLRALTRAEVYERASLVVRLEFDGSALGEREAVDVLGVPVITVHRNPAVARTIDAGLVVSRLPEPLKRLGASITQEVTHTEVSA